MLIHWKSLRKFLRDFLFLRNLYVLFTYNHSIKHLIKIKINMEKIIIGSEVNVPEPNDTDIHNYEFTGTVIEIDEQYAIVEDGDGDCFTIEINRLSLYDIESEYEAVRKYFKQIIIMKNPFRKLC